MKDSITQGTELLVTTHESIFPQKKSSVIFCNIDNFTRVAFSSRAPILFAYAIIFIFFDFCGSLFSSYTHFTIDEISSINEILFYIIFFLISFSAITIYGRALSVLMFMAISFICGILTYHCFSSLVTDSSKEDTLIFFLTAVTLVFSLLSLVEVFYISRSFKYINREVFFSASFIFDLLYLFIVDILFFIFSKLLLINI